MQALQGFPFASAASHLAAALTPFHGNIIFSAIWSILKRVLLRHTYHKIPESCISNFLYPISSRDAFSSI